MRTGQGISCQISPWGMGNGSYLAPFYLCLGLFMFVSLLSGHLTQIVQLAFRKNKKGIAILVSSSSLVDGECIITLQNVKIRSTKVYKNCVFFSVNPCLEFLKTNIALTCQLNILVN